MTVPVLAHGSGIDEALILLVPLVVFGVLLLLGRKKSTADETEGDDHARED